MVFDTISDLRCPLCGAQQGTVVIDSRGQAAGRRIRRRRKCLKCSGRFTTHEVLLSALITPDRDRALRQVRLAAQRVLDSLDDLAAPLPEPVVRKKKAAA